MRNWLHVFFALAVMMLCATAIRAGEELFPDGKMEAKTARFSATVLLKEGEQLRGDAAWDKIAKFVEKGGPDDANYVTISVQEEDLVPRRSTHNNTGLFILLNGTPKKILVSFTAKSDDDNNPEVVLNRIWGGATAARVALTPEWTEHEIELEATGELTLSSIIFAPYAGDRPKTASFSIANISVVEKN